MKFRMIDPFDAHRHLFVFEPSRSFCSLGRTDQLFPATPSLRQVETCDWKIRFFEEMFEMKPGESALVLLVQAIRSLLAGQLHRPVISRLVEIGDGITPKKAILKLTANVEVEHLKD
jgi:hypothetical protein